MLFVVSNKDIEELSRLLDLKPDPLIISFQGPIPDGRGEERELEELKSFLSEWRLLLGKQAVGFDTSLCKFYPLSQTTKWNVSDWKVIKESVFSRAGKNQTQLSAAVGDPGRALRNSDF